MRNLFVIIGLMLFLGLNAQDSYLRKGGAFQGLGSDSDTLTASATVNYSVMLAAENYGVLSIAVESDSVSGTSAYSGYLQKSLNNEDWVNVDTVTHTGGADDYAEFAAVNATHTYWRVSVVATSATQKSNLKIWGRLNEGFVIEN